MFARTVRAVLVTILAAFGLIAGGCSENPVIPILRNPAPVAPVPIVVAWQHPLPQGSDLRRMWGFSDGSFYAVGEAGTVLHYDGATWTLVDTPSREDLHGIWASTPDDIYVAGFHGTLMHYDGSAWRIVPTPREDDFYAVWASGTDDVFVAGVEGTVWNRRGGSWTEYAISPGRQFRALWGYSHDEVYVAGSNAGLFRFDGSTWTRMIIAGLPNYHPEIYDLWGPSPGSISLVEQEGVINWHDGTQWRYTCTSCRGGPYGLWGFSLESQIAVCAVGSAHYNGGFDPTLYPTGTDEPLFDVWGTAPDDLYAVGRYGYVRHFDGTGWRALNAGSVDHVRDLWATPSGAVAVGANGTVLRKKGPTWEADGVGAGYDLSGVWSSGSDLEIAVGRYTPDGFHWRQAVLMHDGISWTDAGAVGVAHRLFDVWGSGPDDAFAVGWAGEIVRYNGGAWSVAVPGDSSKTAFLRSVSGTSPSHVVAVGRTNDLRALVCRYDGSEWTKIVLDDVEELCGVWAHSPTSVVAVGSFGAIRHFDGTTWTRMPSPTTEKLLAVWGSASDDIYATGWAGTILHYDGSAWRELRAQTHRNINSVCGRSSSEVYFASDRGGILLFDGM